MRYKVRYHKKALKQLTKLDKTISALLINWIETNLVDCSDPRAKGKALSGNLSSIWRYRVGDYRILAEIKDDEVLILIINVGHRRDIYR